jgi:Flp pilus assembly pilin Flp
MRRFLARLLRDDSGLTAVEYAVVTGLIVAVGAIAAAQFGSGVRKSTGSVTASGGHASTSASRSLPASSPVLLLPHPASPVGTTALPWALLSILVTTAGVGCYVGGHHVFGRLRQARTRRRVWASLSDVDGLAVMDRVFRTPARRTSVYVDDSRLIGRNTPDLHHWVGSRTPGEVDAIAGINSRPARPEPAPVATIAG